MAELTEQEKALAEGRAMEVNQEQFGAVLDVVMAAEKQRQRIDQAVFTGPMALPPKAATARPYRHEKVRARRKLAASSKAKQRR